MYGAEYEQTDPLVDSHDTDVPCGICHAYAMFLLEMLSDKYIHAQIDKSEKAWLLDE